MPKVRIGDNFKAIPWDPNYVARLLFRGFEVFSDEGLDEATLAEHNAQINDVLRKLWGNKNTRAVRDRSTNPPLGRRNNNFPEKALPLQPPNINSDFINIQPNPFFNNEPTIDLLTPSELPYDRFDFRKKPLKT